MYQMIKRMMFIFMGILLLFISVQTASAHNVQMLYPLYNYPNHWDSSYIWDDIAADGNNIPITAIINPNNGPGGSTDPNSDYVQGLTDLANGGVTTIGYVSTAFGTRNINDVVNDIKKYNDDFTNGTNYSVTGVFIDEVSTVWRQLFFLFNDNYFSRYPLSTIPIGCGFVFTEGTLCENKKIF